MITLQQELAKKVICKDFDKPIRYIAGVDVSCNRFDPKKMVYAAIVVMSYPKLQITEVVTKALKEEFPYRTGLLGFREVPPLIVAYDELAIQPDLILVDGHGISHPRGLGIASHLGVLLNVPTIGVAKSILVGKPKRSSLIWKEKEIGAILRSKKGANPLIISVGHLTNLNGAKQIVMKCLKGYRLPEPTRLAHIMANRCRKGPL